MRRREFLGVLGGAAAAWPISARAQPSMSVVGILHTGAPEENADRVSEVLKGMSEAGYVQGRNVTIAFRWARGDYNRLPALAAELVRHPVNVLFADGGSPAAIAAKAATATIPIVFQTGSDPMEIGLVASINRPGGNVTGIAAFSRDLVAKRLEILREMIPGVAVVAFLNDPSSPVGETRRKAFETAATAIGQRYDVVKAGNEGEIDEAFNKLTQRKIGALVVQGAPRFNNNRNRLADLAARHKIAAIYEQPENARAGGLISYGSSILEASRMSGKYIGRILKGERPADMPVILPTKIELVINLKSAKALGLDVPLFLQQRADEVIE